MIILDIETSGLNPDKASIVSIGAVDFINPDNIFYGECSIFHGAEVNPQSLKVIGMKIEEITDKKRQSVDDLLKKFLNWLVDIQNQTIAGQNVHWDLDFLRHQCDRSGINYRFGHRIIDLHTIAYTKFLELGREIPLKYNRTDINLDDILAFAGLNRRLGSHNALEDAKLESECISRIIFGKNLLEIYKDLPIPAYLRK